MPASVFLWSWCFLWSSLNPRGCAEGHSSMWRGTWEKVAWHSSGNYFQMTFQNCPSTPPHPSRGISWVTVTMLIRLSPFQAGHHRLSTAHTTRHVGVEKLCSSFLFVSVSQETIWLFGVNIFLAQIIKKNPIFSDQFLCLLNELPLLLDNSQPFANHILWPQNYVLQMWSRVAGLWTLCWAPGLFCRSHFLAMAPLECIHWAHTAHTASYSPGCS